MQGDGLTHACKEMALLMHVRRGPYSCMQGDGLTHAGKEEARNGPAWQQARMYLHPDSTRAALCGRRQVLGL